MTQADLPTVLVVDDDPASLDLIAKVVGSAGHEVVTAQDGTEALQWVLQEGIQLIITDCVMPEMDGLELCRAIRSHEGISFAYIIILTAHTDEDRLVEAFEAGADDFLAKPFNRRELSARLRAGVRIILLQQDLDRRNREVHRFNAEMAIAHRELARANEKLSRMATTDELTGLTNRREALARLDEHWASANRHEEPLACITLDIDHFKSFNDTYGHATGDLVLKETAGVLQAAVRREDKVCRIGGEEFLVLCPMSTEEAAAIAAERLRRAVGGRQIKSGGLELGVRISLGVAERTEDMNGPDDLLKAADDALYAAKKAGRNRVCAASANGAPPTAGISRILPDSQRATALTSEKTDDTAGRVLLVDDDADVRTLCNRFLTREGYEVEEAVDGLDALTKVSQHAPDVIIMDAMMPNLDGLECTRRLKADPLTSDIPIIMASVRTKQEDIIAGLEAGVDEYVTKPIRPREFVLRVRSMSRLYRGKQELLRSNEVRGEQTRVLTLLLDFSRDLAVAEDLDAVLSKTIAVTSELTCSHRISIMLPDSENRFLRIAKATGIDKDLAGRVRVPVGGAIAGRVFESKVPVVINGNEEALPQKLQYDSEFFVSVPLLSQALSASEHVVGVLNVTDRQGKRRFEPHELEYVDLIGNIAASAIQDCLTRRARDEARDSIVVALAKLTEYRDSDTGKHLDRVTRFCVLLAQELRSVERHQAVITEGFFRDLERAVPLHDIGKVAVPDHILKKPGALTKEEIAIMRTHTTVGAHALRSVIERVPGVPFLAMAEEIAHGHHEWYDGRGYPCGVSGEDIPLAARIVAVADVYDALTTKRVYKDAMPHHKAAEIIVQSSGTQFDPDVTDAFRRREDAFERLARELADDVVIEPSAVQPVLAGACETPRPISVAGS